MNVVDSSACLEYFANGRNAGYFAPPIEAVGELLVPTICLLEVFRRVLQQRGESASLQAAAQMQQGQVVDLDATLALTAAHLDVEAKLPLAGSVVLATARHHDATLWTQDADFEQLSGVRFRAKRT